MKESTMAMKDSEMQTMTKELVVEEQQLSMDKTHIAAARLDEAILKGAKSYVNRCSYVDTTLPLAVQADQLRCCRLKAYLVDELAKKAASK
jgi:hypothetical protein